MKRLVIIACVAAAAGAAAYGPPTEEERRAVLDRLIEAKAAAMMRSALDAPQDRTERGYDVQEYILELAPDFEAETLWGRTEIRALAEDEALTEVTLDMGPGIEPLAVTDGIQSLQSIHDGALLTVSLAEPVAGGAPFTLVIEYAGEPPGGNMRFAEHAGTPCLATQSEPYGARNWFPCHDDPADKALTRTITTVPCALSVASNGLLTEDVDNGDGTHTVTWVSSYPMSTYLVSIAATNYARIDYEYTPQAGGDPMPVPVYVYPEQLEEAALDFADTVDMIDFFSRSFGEYPFLAEKYGQVAVPLGGGMEHQTITHINASYISGYGLMGLVAHELAHMWWGDCITMETWPHIWLNEGFATYSEVLYEEYRFGPETMRAAMSSYAREEYEGSIYDPPQLFGSIVYYKGAWVLHMLRHVVGDEAFWNVLQDYYAHPDLAYGNATTEDFQAVAEAVHGQPLAWFFQQWIYGEKRPDYVYLWDYAGEGEDYRTTLTLVQQQTEAPVFRMPVDIRITTASGVQDWTITNDAADQSFEFLTDEPPLDLAIDPDVWLLKWLTPDPAQFRMTNDWRLPAADFGAHYQTQLEVAGGTPPFTFVLTEGDLPPGIAFDAGGRFSGSPTRAGTFDVTVRVSDSRPEPRCVTQLFRLKTGMRGADLMITTDDPTYTGGETMCVTLSIAARQEEPLDSQLFVALEAGGEFFFLDPFQTVYPSFTREPVAIPLPLAPEWSMEAEILALPLPAGVGPLSGCWYAALANPVNGTLWTSLAKAEFSLM